MGNAISRRDVMGGAAATAAVLTTTPLRAAKAVVHEVVIKAFTFEPMVVQVHVGDTIRWTNRDLAPHTATADEFGRDTGEIVQGNKGEITISENMETSYFCVFHPHMKGTIQIL